jgi:hypothetical protein
MPGLFQGPAFFVFCLVLMQFFAEWGFGTP